MKQESRAGGSRPVEEERAEGKVVAAAEARAMAVAEARAMAVAEAAKVSSTAHCRCQEVGETLGCSRPGRRRRRSLEAAGTAGVAMTTTAAVAARRSIPGRRPCSAAATASYPIPGCCRCLEGAGTAAADLVVAVETPRATLSCMGVGAIETGSAVRTSSGCAVWPWEDVMVHPTWSYA